MREEARFSLARSALKKICRYHTGAQWGSAIFVGTVLEFGVLNGSYLRRYGDAYQWTPAFWGFDSFVGLPPEAEGQLRPVAWRPGRFSSSRNVPDSEAGKRLEGTRAAKRVRASLVDGTDGRKVHLVPGLFSETLTAELAARILRTSGPAAFIDIDSDLYVSARQALDWVFGNGLAVVGTVIRYDDWWSIPCATRHASNRKFRKSNAPMESYGGEPLAHHEAAHKFGVTFACACGPCDADSGGPQARHFATGWVGFNPFFRVVSLTAPPGDSGFRANASMVDRFLQSGGVNVCANYRQRSSFALETA